MERSADVPEGLRLTIAQVGFACFITSTCRGLRDVAYLQPWSSMPAVLIAASNGALILAFAVFAFLALRGEGRSSARFAGGSAGRRAGFFAGRARVPFALAVAGTLLVLGGYAGTVAAGLLDRVPPALGVLCGACFGVGGAIGFNAWVDAFEQVGASAKYCVVAGSLLGGVAGLALAHPGTEPFVAPVCGVLALFALACLAVQGGPRPEAALAGGAVGAAHAHAGDAAGSPSGFSAVMRHVWRPALCVGTLGMISIVSRFLVDGPDDSIVLATATLGEIIPCLALLLLFALPSFKIDIAAVYKVLFPVVALLFLLLTFTDGRYAPVLAILSGSAFQLCTMLVIVQALEVAEKIGRPAFAVYDACAVVMYAVMFCGYAVIPLGRAYFSYALYPVVAVLMLYVLSMGLIVGLTAGKADRPSVAEGAAGGVDGRAARGAEAPGGAAAAPAGVPDAAGLSSREAEVLQLILAGRDVPYIAAALYLSKNTVRTHVKSIYAKYGVHARQELIDLFAGSVDAAAPDGGAPGGTTGGAAGGTTGGPAGA